MSKNVTPVGSVGEIKLFSDPADGPRGARLILRQDLGAHTAIEWPLLEGEAKQLYRLVRGWVRKQKELRGDTPRGRAKLEERRAGYAGKKPTA